MKIFGREPAFYTGFFEAVLVLLLSLHTFDLTAEKIALIMAVVTTVLGFYTAWVTKDTLLGVGIGATKAILALAVAYKLNLSADTVAAIIGVVTVALGSYQRTQTAPVIKPNFNPSPAAAENRNLLAA